VNTLTAAQNEEIRLATESVRHLLGQIEQERHDAAQAMARQARLDVIKALLPVLDTVEAGILSGVAQIKTMLPTAPEAARTLAAWLNGQRLLLDRLNKLIEADGIHRIPTIGQSFDPYRHVAVKTVQDPTKAPGIILAEERHGYMVEAEVLRYAEVVVNKQ
jgi:molecular chaperone GrpE